MPEYLIRWNTGYGNMHEVVEAESQEEANKIAYEIWREDVESEADYDAALLTDDLREEYNIL